MNAGITLGLQGTAINSQVTKVKCFFIFVIKTFNHQVQYRMMTQDIVTKEKYKRWV